MTHFSYNVSFEYLLVHQQEGQDGVLLTERAELWSKIHFNVSLKKCHR